MTEAREVLESIENRREELARQLMETRLGRQKSPLRKELWWLGQLSNLLWRWIVERG